ncbi:MAG: hypothetical protein ACO3DS_00520 [Phycisphaerales bacterium]
MPGPMTTTCRAALACAALALPAAGYDHYSVVPVVAGEDPAFLRELLVLSDSRLVRFGVFGDSQEASPQYWGRHFIMESNALMAEAFGPASETILLQQAWWDSEPNWLAATHNVTRSGAPALEVPDAAIPPGIVGQARVGPADGGDAFHAVLLPLADRCPITERTGTQWFLDGPSVVVDVLLSRRSTAGSLAWRAGIVGAPAPQHGAVPLAEGELPGQPLDGAAFGWVTTGTLPAAGPGWRQVSILGADPNHPSDVLGIRFRNAVMSRGVVLQPLAVGGAGLGDLTELHGASGQAIAALGLDAAMRHFGANDTGVPAATWGRELQRTIDMLRAAHADPLFPIIIVSDPHRRDVPAQSDYDLFPGVAAALAQANPGVIALNMRRVHEAAFRWTDSSNLGLADVVHLKPHAQRMAARAMVSTMLEAAGIPVPGCAPGQSWADRYHPLGGSCSLSWPCTVLVEADARSIGRPFIPGADCSDADGDGRADICNEAASPDINGDGVVDGGDLGILFSFWGSSDPVADITRDGMINGEDLGLLLIFWGPMP